MSNHQDTERLFDDPADSVSETSDISPDLTVHIPQDSNTDMVYTSQLAAFLITINVTIGAGALAMPASMNEAGVIPSLLIQIPFLIGIIVTLIMCTELTVKSKINSFHALVQAHCHVNLFRLTQLTISLVVFGTIVAFMVIIGDQSDSLLFTLYRDKYCEEPWYMNRNFIMIISVVVFIIPLCSAKTVDFLKYASFLGVLSIAFIVYMVFDQCKKQYHEGSGNKDGWWAKGVNWWPKDDSWINAPLILPCYCLAYQCHLSWVPCAATIRRKEKYISYRTVTYAMIVASLIYSAICVMAILATGENIQKDLTASFMAKNRKDWIVETTIAIVALKCIFTLPPAFLPARMTMLENLRSQFEWFANLSEPTQRISVTTVTMIQALVSAILFKKIQVAVELLGCLCVLFIFPLPALSYLNLVNQNRREKQQAAGDDSDELKYTTKDHIKRYLSLFFIVFGLAMVLLVLYTSISDILKNWGADDDGPCGKKELFLIRHHNETYIP